MLNRIFQQIASRLGMSGYAPSSMDMTRYDDENNGPEAEAHVTFLGGKPTPLSADESVALKTANPNAELTTKDLVWPGKSNTIGFRNEEAQEYRYKLTITNLPASHYDIIPVHGPAQANENGVLLRPGEEAAFDVRFRPESRGKAHAQTFFFVLTRFDPRRSSDPGVVVGEEQARWVSLPDADDFALEATPGELRLRPWRREAPFQLGLKNRSFLPSLVTLHILRGTTRQSLQDSPEQVDVLSQPLEMRMSGNWRCLLPPSRLRNSYWVTVRGTARVGEHYNIPITLLRPMFVRYTPWLRRGRDWAFLGASAFALMWLAWGIPVRKAPVVRFPIQFQGLAEGAFPEGGVPTDLNVQIVSLNHKPLATPIPGVYRGNAYVFEDFPSKLYGYRWPFNSWSSWGAPPNNFEVQATVADPDKQDLYKKYNLAKLTSADSNNPTTFSIPTAKRPFWGEWLVAPTAMARIAQGLRFDVTVEDGGALKQGGNANHEITLMGTLDGEEVLKKSYTPLPQEPVLVVHDLEIDKHKRGTLKIWAEAGELKSEPWLNQVRPSTKTLPVHIEFPGPPTVIPLTGTFRPGDAVVVQGKRMHGRGDVLVNDVKIPATWTPSDISFTLPRDLQAGQAYIKVQPQGLDNPLPAGRINVLNVHPVGPPDISIPTPKPGGDPPARHPHDTVKSPKKGGNEDGSAANAPVTPPSNQGNDNGNGSKPQAALPPTNTSAPKTARPNRSNSQAAEDHNTSVSLSALSPDELLMLNESEQALARAETMLQSPHTDSKTKGLAHAVKGIVLLKRGDPNSDTEIDQAIELTARQSTGRARAMALYAKACRAIIQKMSRDDVVTIFVAATSADPKLAIAWSDWFEYYYAHNYPELANSQYTNGSRYNSQNALFHYRFAQLFHDHDDKREAEESKATANAIDQEKNKARKAILSQYAQQMNNS